MFRSRRHVALDKILALEVRARLFALTRDRGIETCVDARLVDNRSDILGMCALDDVTPEDVLSLNDQLALYTLTVPVDKLLFCKTINYNLCRGEKYEIERKNSFRTSSLVRNPK